MPTQDRTNAMIVTLVIWGFAGALFGALFAGLYQILDTLGLHDWQPLVVAAGAAAMTTSAFYSAMPVALMGAMAGVLASIAYLIVADQQVALPWMVAVAGTGGIAAGSFYSWMVASGNRPLAETLVGLSAGLLAGGVLALLLGLLPWSVGMTLMTAGVVALVGTLFQVSQRWVSGRRVSWLPDRLSAPLVAGVIAAVVGASMWMVGGVTTFMDGPTQLAIERILSEVPAGLAGGAVGGALAGGLLHLLGIRPTRPG